MIIHEGTGCTSTHPVDSIILTPRLHLLQGPIRRTFNGERFHGLLLMLWENEVRHLVMVTKLVERGKKKCECYWPQRVGDSCPNRGDLSIVTLVNLVTTRYVDYS